jgi:hypothetical protein
MLDRLDTAEQWNKVAATAEAIVIEESLETLLKSMTIEAPTKLELPLKWHGVFDFLLDESYKSGVHKHKKVKEKCRKIYPKTQQTI